MMVEDLSRSYTVGTLHNIFVNSFVVLGMRAVLVLSYCGTEGPTDNSFAPHSISVESCIYN